MRFTVDISMDDAAMNDNPCVSLEDVLVRLAESIGSSEDADPGTTWAIYDWNGNRIGDAKVIS